MKRLAVIALIMVMATPTTANADVLVNANAGVSRAIAEDLRNAVHASKDPFRLKPETDVLKVEVEEETIVEEAEAVEVEEVAEEANEADQNDIDLLARLIFAEANTLSYEAQSYAGSVVINRVNSNSYPNTIEGVIYQSGQYACVSDGHLAKATPTEAQYDLAEDLIENGSYIPATVVYQAEFLQGSGLYKQIGNTYFCYE